MSTVASAAPITCSAGLNIGNLGAQCTLDGLDFSFAGPQFSGSPAYHSLAISSAGSTAGQVTLSFVISNPGLNFFSLG
jgi:hypothetical protein